MMTLEINFENQLEKYKLMIYKFIHKYPYLDKEELYQEGLITLYETMETFQESRSSFSTYLYYKLNYRFIDLYRINKNHAKILESLSSTPTSYTPIKHLDPFLLEEILKVLTEKQRKWFEYHHLADLTYNQIAQLENTTIDAVKNWGREARKKLQPFLNAYWSDDMYKI
ncbi:sigma-70 family RNA polymerase sigma factor [Thalassobacillus devorans]|uniref:sigma-70 family RNA polymerase sigma factor n=1 Tax=Thalassobacillus devorans TaxID=279813 RepID=UPI0013772F80|nr:sigma-70 family RNA polymerase sigma factor [Thalassobacillus devorans]